MNSYIKDDLDTMLTPDRPVSLESTNCAATSEADAKTHLKLQSDESETLARDPDKREWDTIPKKPPILSSEAIRNKWKQLTTYGKSKRTGKT